MKRQWMEEGYARDQSPLDTHRPRLSGTGRVPSGVGAESMPERLAFLPDPIPSPLLPLDDIASLVSFVDGPLPSREARDKTAERGNQHSLLPRCSATLFGGTNPVRKNKQGKRPPRVLSEAELINTLCHYYKIEREEYQDMYRLLVVRCQASKSWTAKGNYSDKLQRSINKRINRLLQMISVREDVAYVAVPEATKEIKQTLVKQIKASLQREEDRAMNLSEVCHLLGTSPEKTLDYCRETLLTLHRTEKGNPTQIRRKLVQHVLTWQSAYHQFNTHQQALMRMAINDLLKQMIAEVMPTPATAPAIPKRGVHEKQASAAASEWPEVDGDGMEMTSEDRDIFGALPPLDRSVSMKL